MKIVHNIVMPPEAGENDVFQKVIKKYSLPKNIPCKIYRRSVDCRRGDVKKVYSVALDTEISHPDFSDLTRYEFIPDGKVNTETRPVIVGMGPAGLFCALTLAEFGIKPIIIDRGRPVEKRVEDVENFWAGKPLDEESNVQFGEGGAGTFSDGKLTCRKNDPRSRKVLETFVRFGAKSDILTDALPHIGTDILRKIIVNMRRSLIEKGAEFMYETKLTDIVFKGRKADKIITTKGAIECESLVLAIGNGSFDTFSMLLSKDLEIEAKPLSVGVRQEHLQTDINRAVYGKFAESPFLPPAVYSFFNHLDKNTCVYTFCMCPGGAVVNASSLNGRLTVNGMSYLSRDLKNANSALLVTVNPSSVKEAMRLQKQIEKSAFLSRNGAVPVSNTLTTSERISTAVLPSVLPRTEYADFSEIFPEKILSALIKGSDLFHKAIFKTRAFEKPVYTAPETRTSSPLRLKRSKDSLKALFCENVYPCGEGAGYAGGIMSSAIDGIKVAEAIINAQGV